MALQTANTLFHFTDKLEFILDTISNGFSPRYSLETDYTGNQSYIPMVCFCDIPLSMISDHMLKYGRYGRGMTKEWGIKNKLNPVLYYNKESTLTSEFFRLLHQSKYNLEDLFIIAVDGKKIKVLGDEYIDYDRKNLKNKKITTAYDKPMNTISYLSALEYFFKPREGSYTIKGICYQNYHFYDERVEICSI